MGRSHQQSLPRAAIDSAVAWGEKFGSAAGNNQPRPAVNTDQSTSSSLNTGTEAPPVAATLMNSIEYRDRWCVNYRDRSHVPLATRLG
jgi:hypothetical protein